MIWDKLSPFYDFFENIYNGKCYKGIAEKIKEYVNQMAKLYCLHISIMKKRTL